MDQALLDILACPKCKESVQYNDDKTALLCQKCQLAYPIRDDIPVMLIDEANPLAAS
ncbi:MAG: Trm112 family protein [Mariprofundaceae bacterium]|nr:Trm112 family protein [Mariprofundaceae bacterium]